VGEYTFDKGAPVWFEGDRHGMLEKAVMADLLGRAVRGLTGYTSREEMNTYYDGVQTHKPTGTNFGAYSANRKPTK